MKYLGMVCAIFSLDGIIKRRIDQKAKKTEKIFGKCKITRYRNEGAVYSIGEKYPKKVRVISALMLVGVAAHWLCVVNSRKGSKVEKVGTSLLFGGSLSNVWDRFTRKYVVDYIHIDMKYLRKIVFNISDVCIVIGGCITMIVTMFRFLKEE